MPFLVRVNKKDVPDYYSIIKTPMDFGTMAKKLKAREYISKQSFHDDLEQIYTNCFMYNTAEDSIYRQHAQMLRDKWSYLMKAIPETQSPETRTKRFEPAKPSQAKADDIDSLLNIHLESLSDIDSEPSPKKTRSGTLDTISAARTLKFEREPAEQVVTSLGPHRPRTTHGMHQYAAAVFRHRQSTNFMDIDGQSPSDSLAKAAVFPEIVHFFNTFPDSHLHSMPRTATQKLGYSTKPAHSTCLHSFTLLKEIRQKRARLIDHSRMSECFLEGTFEWHDHEEEKIGSGRQALMALRRVVLLSLAQYGFESAAKAAVMAVTELVEAHLQAIFHVFRLLHDRFHREQEPTEIVRLTVLQACKLGSLNELIGAMQESKQLASRYSRINELLERASSNATSFVASMPGSLASESAAPEADEQGERDEEQDDAEEDLDEEDDDQDFDNRSLNVKPADEDEEAFDMADDDAEDDE